MKISELITELETIKASEGDLAIYWDITEPDKIHACSLCKQVSIAGTLDTKFVLLSDGYGK